MGNRNSWGRWEVSVIFVLFLRLFVCFYPNHWLMRASLSHIWLYFGNINLVCRIHYHPWILKTMTRPISAFVVWGNLGLGVTAFGSETGQQGLFVLWISDYNNACQIALCFMPKHAATSEGKVPLYWEPSDMLWCTKECSEWISILRKHVSSWLEMTPSAFRNQSCWIFVEAVELVNLVHCLFKIA